MNKSYDELCDEILQLREQLQAAQQSALSARANYLEARLEKTSEEREQLALTLQAYGQLIPTDYDDRDELFRAMLHIQRTAPQGLRQRVKAIALRDYANSLPAAHACLPHLLSEAERLEKLADQQNGNGCQACDSRPGQYHAPECPAVDAFTAGRIANRGGE